jgi:hypothetical protein
MRRRLFDLAAALSAVVLLAVSVLWPMSYWYDDLYSRGHGLTYTDIQSREGRLHVRWITRTEGLLRRIWQPDYYQLAGFTVACNIIIGEELPRHIRILPFSAIEEQGLGLGTELQLPDWSLELLFAILPSLWLGDLWRKRRKHKAGCCVACGYDLRAHRPGEKCPECGTGIVPCAPR